MDAIALKLALAVPAALLSGGVAVASARRLFLAHGATAVIYGVVCAYAIAACGSLLGVFVLGTGGGLRAAGLLLSAGSAPLWFAVRAVADADPVPRLRRGADPIFHSVRQAGRKALRP